jgi:phosphate transport system substrate-binding protein
MPGETMNIKSFKLILCLIIIIIISASTESYNTENNDIKITEAVPTPADTGSVLLVKNSANITIEGSTSAAVLLEVLAEAFMEKNPDIKVEIMANGTNAAIKAVRNSSADLGMVSRYLKTTEKTPGMKEVIIAWDVLAVVINPENNIKNLQKNHISEIYSGRITNWSIIGGFDMPIHVISREEGSGTYQAFKSLIGIEKITPSSQVTDGNGSMIESVAGKINSIGYVSMGFINNRVKVLSIDGIYPTKDNILNNLYTLKRPFSLIYIEDRKKNEVTEFIAFINSEEVRSMISKKYIPTEKTE